jgi:hypothetical protein
MIAREPPLRCAYNCGPTFAVRAELLIFYLYRSVEYTVARRFQNIFRHSVSDTGIQSLFEKIMWKPPRPVEVIDQASIKKNFAQVAEKLNDVGRLIFRSDGVDCALLRLPAPDDPREHNMQTTYFQHHIGEALDLAAVKPLTILRHNEPIAVLEILDAA